MSGIFDQPHDDFFSESDVIKLTQMNDRDRTTLMIGYLLRTAVALETIANKMEEWNP